MADKEIILVVEDNQQLAEFVTFTLLPSLGYEGRVAYNGNTALQTIRLFPPALVLLDFELPDTNGLDFLRQLAAEGQSVPTILMTAHGSEHLPSC